MSDTSTGVVRRLTGYLGSWQKERLWRAGFRESLATDSWSADEIRAYHDRTLVSLVNRTASAVPFYRDLYAKAGVNLKAFRGVQDLHLLPLISKRDLLSNGNFMLAPGISPLRTVHHTTGGSTGTIATIVSPRGIASRETGCIYALWNRIGVKREDRMVVLRGALLEGGRVVSQRDRTAQRRLTISTYHLSDATIDEVIQLINAERPDWLHVYPSAAALLAGVMQRTARAFSFPLRGILCASENVYAWQRELFAAVFRCPVYAHYGHGEMTILGGGCSGSDAYHFLPNHGYLELVDAHGQPVAEPGVPGEIVGTGYLNPVMPLIRYRTQDYGTWAEPGPCPACGRAHQRLATIEGRLQEYLVLASGRRFPVTNINALHGTFFSLIYRFQFIQRQPGFAILRYVPVSPLTEAQRNMIAEAFAFLGPLGLHLELQPVLSIPVTRNGKQRIVLTEEEART